MRSYYGNGESDGEDGQGDDSEYGGRDVLHSTDGVAFSLLVESKDRNIDYCKQM